MSSKEKMQHQRRGISRARSVLHKYDGHKMSAVVNHVHFERLHGFESTKHKLKHESGQGTST
jgi:hypothetical protein